MHTFSLSAASVSSFKFPTQQSSRDPTRHVLGPDPVAVAVAEFHPRAKARRSSTDPRYAVTLRLGRDSASGLPLSAGMAQLMFVITHCDSGPMECADIAAMGVGITIGSDRYLLDDGEAGLQDDPEEEGTESEGDRDDLDDEGADLEQQGGESSADGDDPDDDGRGPLGAPAAAYRLSDFARLCNRNDLLVPVDTEMRLRAYMRHEADAGVCAYIRKYLRDASWMKRGKLLVPSESSGRLRQSVCVNLRRAIKRIEEISPRVGQYLRRHLQLGALVRYTGVRFELVLGSGLELRNLRKAAA